jgi:DNA-directed RNA polymerase specialized sigma24 family protein
MVPESNIPPGASRFDQTQWSLVLAAGAGDASGASAALARLCEGYWYPLYSFVRRQGTSHHDAQDLTQAFFGKLLEKHYLGDVVRSRGRFRTFLLASLKHFMANEWDKRSAKKRGGGIVFVPLDASAADRFEKEALLPASRECTAEERYDQRWAHILLDRALGALRSSYEANDQAPVFEALKPCLTLGKGAAPYAAVGTELGMDENAVKVAAHRLRHRYREAIRTEIANTVSEEEDIEEEFLNLRKVLSRP